MIKESRYDFKNEVCYRNSPLYNTESGDESRSKYVNSSFFQIYGSMFLKEDHEKPREIYVFVNRNLGTFYYFFSKYQIVLLDSVSISFAGAEETDRVRIDCITFTVINLVYILRAEIIQNQTGTNTHFVQHQIKEKNKKGKDENSQTYDMTLPI